MMIIQRFFRDSGSSFRTGSLLAWAVLGLEEFAFWMLTWLDSFAAAATAEEAPAAALFLNTTTSRMARPATAMKVNTVMRAMFLFLVESSSVVTEAVVVVVVEAQAWSPWEVKGKLGS